MILKAEIYTLFKLKAKKQFFLMKILYRKNEDLIPSTTRQENPIAKEDICVT